MHKVLQQKLCLHAVRQDVAAECHTHANRFWLGDSVLAQPMADAPAMARVFVFSFLGLISVEGAAVEVSVCWRGR